MNDVEQPALIPGTTPPTWLGVMGGGQLGRMFAQAAQTLGYRVATLEPEGDGTRLRLIHRDLTGEQREMHDAGWRRYVARLKIAAEGGEPGPDAIADKSIQHR